jgi:hypothetical protein
VSNAHDLPHGVHYVPRDGSAIYDLTGASGAADRLAVDEVEATVAKALLEVSRNRIYGAESRRNNTSTKPPTKPSKEN